MDAGGDDDEPLRSAVARCAARASGTMIREAHCPRRPEAAPTTEKRRARVHPGDVFTHDHGDRRSGASAGGLIYGTLQWSRRRRGPTQAVREASTRELYREGARAEKREEAGKAPAGEKPASRPPRMR